MPAASPSEGRSAIRAIVPLIPALVPFGMLFGTYAEEAGLTLLQAMGMTGTIYAGASQLVALQLFGAGAPLWSILLAVFALNFRHILYSASIGRYLQRFSAGEKLAAFFLLVDPVFGASEMRVRQRALTKTFYFTYALVIYATWFASSWLGFVFGSLIDDPRAYGLDFVLPVWFLALVMGFRGRGRFWAVASISALVAIGVYLTLGSPWHVTIGGLSGILYAALAADGRDAPCPGGREGVPGE